MARVETVLKAESPAQPLSGIAELILHKRPDDIKIDPRNQKARPGPVTGNEASKIVELAQSMRELGQIVPLIGWLDEDYNFWALDGARRIKAAQLIESEDKPRVFPLACFVNNSFHDERLVYHVNLKRRGLTPLQLALAFEETNREKGWTGTKKLAEYFGVSRAQVSQHLKILNKPADMSDEAYQQLLSKLNSGLLGSESAFFLLTQVKLAKAEEVITTATQKSQERLASKKVAPTPPKPSATSPRGSNKQESAVKKNPAPAKTTPPARITTEQLRQAAIEHDALVSTHEKKLPDFERMALSLSEPCYPDLLRSFITLWFQEWKRGGATDAELRAAWTNIAQMVNKQVMREQSSKSITNIKYSRAV